jgi:hypothetical protein
MTTPSQEATPQVIQLKPDSILASDGLRYKFKGGGSPFQDSANMSTMSCYRCGLHKSRSLGTFTRLLNQRMFLCQECTPKVIKPRD